MKINWIRASGITMLSAFGVEIACIAAFFSLDRVEMDAAIPLIIVYSAPVLAVIMYPFMWLEWVVPGNVRCPICGASDKRQKADRCRGACRRGSK
jgi:hypothetical protein